MLTVRVVPRRGVVARSAWATVEITTTLAVAHTAAGGELPSVPWIAAMAGVVFVAGLAVLTGRVSTRVAVPALVVVQLLLHLYLTLLSAPHVHEAVAHTQMQQGVMDHLDHILTARMLIAHVIGAVVTASAWEFRARAVEVLVAWTTPRRPLVEHARRVVTATPRRVRPASEQVIAVSPRRGPPAQVRLA